MTITNRIAALAASWTARAVAMAIVILVAIWALSSWRSGQSAKVEARLNENQVEAVTASGRDAVATIGEQQSRADAIDKVTEGNRNEILSSEGADAPVGPDLRDAGLRSLCKRAAYRDHPDCLRFAPAR